VSEPRILEERRKKKKYRVKQEIEAEEGSEYNGAEVVEVVEDEVK
jgi:hypothetical protein